MERAKILAKPKEKDVTNGGIIIPDHLREKGDYAIVEEVHDNDPKVSIGDKVLYDPDHSHLIDIDGEAFVIVEEAAITAKLEGDDFRPLKDVVFVEADFEDSYSDFKKKGDLYIPTKYRKFESDVITQKGKVVSAPEYLEDGTECEVKEGDIVYTHHFLQEEKKKKQKDGGRIITEMRYQEIYCVVDGDDIRMVGNWNFVKPVEEPEENYMKGGIMIKPQAEMIPNVGTIEHLSDSMNERGLSKGDKIIFKDDREYEMFVEGEKYYRIQNLDIVGIMKEPVPEPIFVE